MAGEYRFSGPVTVFHERPLPERATPAGYAALIDAFGLRVPLPRTLSAVSEHHRIRNEDGWRILTPRHAPTADLEGHLTFALKYEGLDLAVLKRLFAHGGSAADRSARAREADRQLRAAHLVPVRMADRRRGSICPTRTVAPMCRWSIRSSNGQASARTHRATASRTTCPAHRAFCPLVFRTQALDEFARWIWRARARPPSTKCRAICWRVRRLSCC